MEEKTLGLELDLLLQLIWNRRLKGNTHPISFTINATIFFLVSGTGRIIKKN